MRLRDAGFVIASVAFAGAWVACSSAYSGEAPPIDGADAPSSDAPAGDSPALLDGSPPDAPVDAPADATDAGGVIAFDDFETGNDCGAWQYYHATLTLVSGDAHSGTHACQICYDGADTHGVRSAPARGPGQYHFEAWVKRVPTSDASTTASQLYLLYDGGQDVHFDPGTVDDTWRLVTSDQASAQTVDEATVWIYLDQNPGTCILVDDAKLTFSP